MDAKCTQCTDFERTNQHRLKPLLLPITYESSELIGNLDLPRRYTSTHNDLTSEIYLSIGHNYNKILLSSEEAVKNQTQVLGKWVKNGNKYEIHLKVFVSTKQNPNAVFRNKIICAELGTVLEGIAFAETALLEQHPHLGNAKFLVHFISIDEKYDRVEYWHRLKYWTQNYKPSGPKIEKEKPEKQKLKKKHHHERRPPLMCPSCRK